MEITAWSRDFLWQSLDGRYNQEQNSVKRRKEMRIFRDPTTGTKYYSYGAPSDSKDMRVSFTSSDVADGSANSWTSVTPIASGEKHASLFAKISQMFKNVRYLYKLLGTTDFSGLGSDVSGAIDNLGDIIVKGVETTSTASQAYAINEYMIYNKKIYKVKAAIASGATITVGTNIESANTNVGNELTSLRSSLTPQTISFTPNSGVAVEHNYCYKFNGFAFISLRLKVFKASATTGEETLGYFGESVEQIALANNISGKVADAVGSSLRALNGLPAGNPLIFIVSGVGKIGS